MSELEKRIKELATKPAKDYQAKAADLSGITHNYMASLAKELAPVLTAQAQGMPSDTHEQKKEVARWVNGELRRFGLAIKCPKTGQPATIVVSSERNPELNVFVYIHRSTSGKVVYGGRTDKFPELELVEAPPRREAIKEWNDKARDMQNGASRG